ncbi:MAG: hypothetical protein SV487_01275 [Thermodesulfobacteriota bacterium]|nr:hypothetical protein [Thermodesulfobacteriota bacterium]
MSLEAGLEESFSAGYQDVIDTTHPASDESGSSYLVAEADSGESEDATEEPQGYEGEDGDRGLAAYGYESGKITENLSLIADLNLSYAVSNLDAGDAIEGFSFNGLLAPIYEISDSRYFIFMYEGVYYKKRDFYSDEYGAKQRVEYQSHTITPMFRFDFGEADRYSLIPLAFYTATLNKDTEDTDWNDGLYNYTDVGAGMDFEMRDLGVGEATGVLKMGIQYYTRNYSNYVSLLDLAIGLDVERDEKDYNGIIFNAGFDWLKVEGFAWTLNYYFLYKMLDDKKVVNQQGVLTDDEQRDYRHILRFKMWYIWTSGLTIGLETSLAMTQSNQNYYDGMGTLLLNDDFFMSDFYDYTSYRLKPNISYSFAMIPLTLSFSYAFQELTYDGRMAKTANRTYKDDKQWETEQEIILAARYELTERWSLLAQWQQIIADSNNEDETVYVYDYLVNNYSIGVSYLF